ncbi:surface antigen (D15) [Tepidicaulis marinus]|uniref:Surface antigen (D15) n=1 Tax=Tepidicaulis marinus TaxID=1333998 RepID=A0A081BDR4_9HYPH|nr:hypothetical protein [Tepidicaulis marinus]GAK46182.1 surface antigen (D15) [Tepidicaulis marinus]
MQNTQLYGFYEAAAVEQVTVLPGSPRRETIESAGVGVRTALFDQVNLDLYVAKPFEKTVQAERDRDARVFFQISSSF